MRLESSRTLSRTITRSWRRDYLFPRFEKAHKLTDLVAVLRQQHKAGREVTSQIQQLAAAKSAGDRQKLAAAIAAFIRMYRPHEAREDTVLFPALHQIVSADEFDALAMILRRKSTSSSAKRDSRAWWSRSANWRSSWASSSWRSSRRSDHSGL